MTAGRWLARHLLWDDGSGWGLGAWRPWLAIAGSAILTWREWVTHHPPEIVLIAVIHFIFVLLLIAIPFNVIRWLGNRR